jgi:hypothetical protein
MNLNLFLIPAEAKREFDMKMAAQRRELERQLTDLGYHAVMTESIPLHVALARANPAYKNNNSAMVNKIYINSVFGAMAKHPFPVANLLVRFERRRLICDESQLLCHETDVCAKL